MSAAGTLEMPSGQIRIPREEILRYMGVRGAADEVLSELIDAGLADFEKTVRYQACYAVLPVRMQKDGVDFGAFFAPGLNLMKNLAGCSRAIAFVATTGMAAEMQRKRSGVCSPAHALALDAIGTAAIEGFCDALCAKWQREFSPGALRPRFSPGYGDLPLALQKPLLDYLDSRRIGISLTDALLMIPQKSVSAFVGVGGAEDADMGGCAQCGDAHCEFRR